MKKRRGIKNKCFPTNYLFPTEVFAGILRYFLPKSRVFTDEPKILHSVLYGLREEGYKLLSDFRFDKWDYFPYSETIEQIIYNLEESCMLERTGWSSLEKLKINPRKLEDYFESSVKPRLDRRQLKELQDISKKLLGGLKKYSE